MKKTIALLLVLVLSLMLVACGGGNDEEPTDSEYFIGLSMHNQTADWAVQFKDSFLEAADAKGVKVAWTDANSTAATQVNDIEDLVAQGIDLLVVVPTDYSALGQALQSAAEAGVTIVDADSKVVEEDQQYCTAFITADCYAGGYTCGEYLAETLPEGATIGTLNYPQIQAIADRFIGMQDAFNDKGRDDIITIEKICTDLNAIATYTEDMLIANPEIAAFVCLNDNTALSCWGACDQLDHGECIVIGFDGSPAAKQSIANGEMTATLVYSPVDIANNAFDTAYAILTGADYEADLQVPMWMINPDNIGELDVNKWE